MTWEADIEANSEKEALEKAKNGDGDWEQIEGFEVDDNVNDFEIVKDQ